MLYIHSLWVQVYRPTKLRPSDTTRSSAIAEGPHDASCQLKSCQLPRNSAETTCTTNPEYPLCANMTSSIKPEVHNTSQRRQKRTETRPSITCTKRSRRNEFSRDQCPVSRWCRVCVWKLDYAPVWLNCVDLAADDNGTQYGNAGVNNSCCPIERQISGDRFPVTSWQTDRRICPHKVCKRRLFVWTWRRVRCVSAVSMHRAIETLSSLTKCFCEWTPVRVSATPRYISNHQQTHCS